ncbi:hypothetical protein [Gracilinema caldarium]|uniref:Glycosyltransferase n=1 Tax=Gracilinema caldarium (strain ATCC 51460 / DSM 7334 / H1) TaxID=744872 RepID=F8F0S2_GRAC1|nr:hypothetical protein [Gracilinema caldarium]AEJ19779.1 hypothetical protein Spica_1636 [Gracilinema caldarium DSM 7334]
MSTIPSTFNQNLPAYTVIGKGERGANTGMSAVLLSRGGRYLRRSIFQDLEKAGFDYVLSVETGKKSYDIEELSLRYPFAQFLILKENLSFGEQINIAAMEVRTPLFFVLWNDVRFTQSGGAERIAERILQSDQLCTVPVVQNTRFEPLPTLIIPALYRGTIRTIPFVPVKEGSLSLYPFDGVGVYHTEKFINLTGYDVNIRSPYWQLMDFGFRAYLWGEKIKTSQLVKVVYDGEPVPQDTSMHPDYRRFYLKNIAPVFRGDTALLPWRRLIPYLLKSGEGFRIAWRNFRSVREWVELFTYRFQMDARQLAELWEETE